jgi:uncharacterized protein YprB with RNaseH-like and TPR domain
LSSIEFSPINLANRKYKKEESDKKGSNDDRTAFFSIQKAAENLIKKAKNRKEFSIVSKQAQLQSERPNINKNRWVFNSDHQKALKLKKTLFKKFKNKTLQEAIPGKVVSNNYGNFYSIEQKSESIFKKADSKKCKNVILSDLKLISGIGAKRERDLRKRGFFSITDLRHHSIWKSQAKDFVNLIEKNQINKLQTYLWKSLPKSHPIIHYLASLTNPKDFAIVDIETLGLSERPIILLGIGKIKKNKVHTSQFLLRDIEDEPSAIRAFMINIQKHNSLISYNGRSFDIPYVHQRLAYYGMEGSIDNPHFDLLHFVRRALRRKLVNCRLETVEQYLNIGRGINIPGSLVPDFYDTYLKTENVGPLVAIVEHNKQDLVTLATLFSKLYEEWSY